MPVLLQTRCPQCGDLLVLHEWGDYSGRRLIDEDGSIVEYSYMEHGSDNLGFSLMCATPGCRKYEDRDIAVTEDRVFHCDDPAYHRLVEIEAEEDRLREERWRLLNGGCGNVSA